MGHLSEGTLRRLLDEPVAVGDEARQHAQTCPRCRAGLAAARSDRDGIALLLTGPAGADPARPDPAELDAAWTAVRGRLAAGPEPASRASRGGTVPVTGIDTARRRLRRPVLTVAVAAVLAVGTTAAAAAANWLPIFKPQTVAPVSFQISSMATLPDLSAYGTLAVPKNWQPEPVADAAAASQKAGVQVPQLRTRVLGVNGAPTYSVLPADHADFTFSAAKARAAAAAQGKTLPPMPAGIDGATLQLKVGPAVVEAWQQGGELPTLTLLRMPAPTVSSQGVSFSTLRDYLLAQPGIPAGVAAQLKALPVDGTVLPVPVPSDLATSRSVTIQGTPGTELALRDRSGGALLWIQNGQLNLVFGLLSSADLLSVARGLG